MRLLLVFISLFVEAYGMEDEMSLPGQVLERSAFTPVKEGADSGMKPSPSTASLASSTTFLPSSLSTCTTPRSRADSSSPFPTFRSLTPTPRTVEERIDALRPISHLRGKSHSWWAGFFEMILKDKHLTPKQQTLARLALGDIYAFGYGGVKINYNRAANHYAAADASDQASALYGIIRRSPKKVQKKA